MKRLSLILLLCASLFALSAQNNAVRLTRTGESTQKSMPDQNRASTWLSWASYIDDGVVNNSYMDNVIFAERFTTSDLAPYNGFQLTQIAFYVESGNYSPSGSYSVKVYQGGSYTSSTSMNAGTLVASQAVSSVNLGSLTTVTLNTPITIDASQELWFGVGISNVSTDSYMMGFDETSTITGKGSLVWDSDDNEWYDLNDYISDFQVSSWAIEAFAVDPNGGGVLVDLLTWYIDNGTSQNEISSMTVPYGSDFSPVVVAYNANYGDAVNDFNGVITYELTLDGTFIGTYATGTTAISSGSGVYFDDITIFPASYIASHNYYGTHTFCMNATVTTPWEENDPSDNSACLTVNFEGPTNVTHTITVLNTDGTITPSGNVTVSDGAAQTFTITPGACRTIVDVLADGVSVLSSVTNNTYTFYNVTADHTFQVTYSTPSFNLTASTNGHGSVNPTNTTLQCGNSITYTFTPNPGYMVEYVTDNTMDVTSSVNNNTYTLTNVTADHDIYVSFVQDASQTFNLTASTDGHGTITPTQATVQGGGSQVFTIVPDNGYEIDFVTDNTMDVTANVANNIYSLTNIGEDHTIYVAFTASSTPADTYTLTASTDGNGTITPTNATVNAGYSQSFTLTANNGFSLLSLTDNGTDVTAQVANNTYTLTNIQSNHTLYATFQDDTPPVEPCDVPTNINMSETGLLTWTSDAQSWTIRYTVNGITYSVNISTLSFQIPGLQPGDVVDVTIQADCGNDNLSDWSESSSFTYNPNGVAQYRLTNVQLFPNPANETLHVRCDIPMQKVEIYNVVGGLMMTVEPNASSTDLNLSTLPSGVFFVRITADGQVCNGKFIKK